MKERKEKGLMPRPHEAKGPVGGAGRRKKYSKPKIVSSSAEELLERLGSARACSGYVCAVFTPS